MAKGIQKLRFSFEETALTHFGGMFLFQQFCRKLDLKRLLQSYVPWTRRSNVYHSSELVMTILYTMVAGMERMAETRILPYNGYFRSLLGLESFPDSSTLRKFLKVLTFPELQGIIQVHDLLRKAMFHQPSSPSSLTLDLDSTVLPLYGWQIEQANIGYNPKKKGRPSYHPLICFDGHSRDSWHGILRPGDTHATTEIRSFWQTCLKKIPKYLYRIRVRADSAFFDHQFIDPLDEDGIGFTIVAKMTRPIQRQIQQLQYQTFREIGGWQAATFMYQPTHWKKAYRFSVIRRPKPKDDNEAPQLTLWEFNDYLYHTLVSNLSLDSPGVWHFYKRRCRAELDIRELKESFPLGKIPSKYFLANQVHFHLILLAYDLVNWFKRLCLPHPWSSATLRTIRTDLLVLPARLVYSAGKNQLKLSKEYPHQKLFHQTLSNIHKLKIR